MTSLAASPNVPNVRSAELKGRGWRLIVTICAKASTAEITLGTDSTVCAASAITPGDLLDLAELFIAAANELFDNAKTTSTAIP